jgi:hypothetical protein
MPSWAVEVTGHVVRSWFRRIWAPSRAVAARALSRADAWDGDALVRRSGFGSCARRLPRSKV